MVCTVNMISEESQTVFDDVREAKGQTGQEINPKHHPVWHPMPKSCFNNTIINQNWRGLLLSSQK